MEQPFLFRPMCKEDVKAVAQIEQICFRSPWTEHMLMSEMKNRLAHYHVMEQEGKIAAYAGMWILFDEAHITNVAVLPQYRRKGLGRKLMLFSMQTAVRFGANKMTLEVRESNVGAQTLYAGVGFVKAGKRRKYYSDTGEDAYILWNEDIQATLEENGLETSI